MGESGFFASALTAGGSLTSLLPPQAADPLSLRPGGKDVHLGLCVSFALRSELLGQSSEEKLLDFMSESSGLDWEKVLSHEETSGGCGLQLH